MPLTVLLISVAVPLLKMPPTWLRLTVLSVSVNVPPLLMVPPASLSTENSDSAEVHCESAPNNQDLTLDTCADDGGRCSTARDGEIPSYNRVHY